MTWQWSRTYKTPRAHGVKSEPDIAECAIFQFQTIEVDGVTFNLFFDTGCGNMIVRKSAVDKLVEMGRAKQVFQMMGEYSICLPLYDDRNATMTGLCLSKVTSKFPIYELGAVEKDLKIRHKKLAGKILANQRPAGGDTDILIVIQNIFQRRFSNVKMDLVYTNQTSQAHLGQGALLQGFSRIEKEFRGLHANKMAYYLESLNELRRISF